MDLRKESWSTDRPLTPTERERLFILLKFAGFRLYNGMDTHVYDRDYPYVLCDYKTRGYNVTCSNEYYNREQFKHILSLEDLQNELIKIIRNGYHQG